MKKIQKVFSMLLALAMVTTSMTACGSSSSSQSASGAASLKSEMHIAINAAPSSLDITKTGTDVARSIVDGNVFESLVNMKSDSTAGLELAKSFDVNKDYTEYTYHLRTGVKFHNGQEMKADDVVASMNRWISSFGNAKQMVGNSTFVKVDDYTVKITLASSTPYLNELMGSAGQQPAIMPASVIANADPETGFVKEYVGTGPYKVAEWKQDQYIKLVKFDDYSPYGTKNKIDARVGYKVAATPTVYYDFVKDDATRASGMLSGEYDFAFKLPPDNFSIFNENSQYKVYNTMAGSLGMIYNKKTGLSANEKFRQAVNAALNDRDIMSGAYGAQTFYRLDPSYMAVEQKDWYSKEGSDAYNIHDASKVASLLKEANYNGETFTLLVSSDYTEFYNAAVVIAKELNDLGIKCKLKVCDWATFLKYRADPSAFDAFITSWTPIAVPTLFNWLTPNYAGWLSDKKLLDYESKLNSGTDTNAAKTLWKNEIQKYCWDESLPISKLGDFNMYCVSSSKVKNAVYFMGPFAYNVTVAK
jgi:peptide/nickel transport system substrate-binding protein